MRQEKKLLKQEIVDKLDFSPSFVVMKYSQLKANAANTFRRELKKIGGDLKVIRKRVLLKAIEDVGLNLDFAPLEGHVGIVFLGNDPIEVTKFVFNFNQDKAKFIDVLGGRFDGQLYNGSQVEQLSKLPSKDEMRAQLLGLLVEVPAQTLAVMSALLTSVPHCLENKCKKDQENAEIEN